MDVVRTGAVARRDTEREAALARWRADAETGRVDDPEAIRERLEAQARGEWEIVRLDLFADALDAGARLRRFDSVPVSGVWFAVPHGDGNERHAREMAGLNLERLREDLLAHGVDVPLEQLAQLPFRLELSEEVRARLR